MLLKAGLMNSAPRNAEATSDGAGPQPTALAKAANETAVEARLEL